MASKKQSSGVLDQLPVDRLMAEVFDFGRAFAKHGMGRVTGGLESITEKFGDVADAPGVSDVAKGASSIVKDGNPVKGGAEMVKGGGKAAASKVKDSVGGAVDAVTPGGSKSKQNGTDLKVTNIVESVDVPVPREIAYEQWTQFEEFPSFMKKVENVSQEEDDVLTWKAQIFWSHRTWKAKIVEQVPPERIVWKSEAEKGKVDGAVTFHELAPDLTRVLVSLEYHPQGLFEKTGNIWRAQGRRVRAELKHYRRHIANHTILKQDEIDGWTGEIHDGEVEQNPDRSSDSGTAKKSAAKKSAAKKSGSARKSSSAKKSSSAAKKSSPAKKSSSPAKKSGSAKKSSPAKKSAAKKSSPAKKSAAKKSASKRSTGSRRQG
jgi:uncharacterized membrane protein